MSKIALPASRGSKDFEDLRHRAAFVHVTGWLPTHLRDHMSDLLAKVTRYSKTPSALDGKGGGLMVPKTKASALKLDQHPMVEKVQEFVNHGYSIQPRRAPKARRPYGKVFLYKGNSRVTVQSDGSVLNHW